MRNVPRTMSTQHPDNVATPFFADSEVLAGEAEVKEAYFVFSQLGCREQMWDSEGKEADNQVVEKLLSRYPDFFSRNRLGRDVFLTYRVPNPAVEKGQGKILLETLQSIPRAYDVARAAGADSPPIFEVILPMATSKAQIEYVKDYYEKAVVGQKEILLGELGNGGMRVSDWVGDFQPEQINVIPLFEDFDSIRNCGEVVSDYVSGKDLEYQRVFIARSDPALNYGAASAVLLAKIALQKLHIAEEKLGIPILPILGVGSAPFRGNFRPDNVDNCGEEYPSVQTFTVQSSFKYDHQFKEVAGAIDSLDHINRGKPREIDEKEAVSAARKIISEYQKQVASAADVINGVSAFVPNRRARKLHIGLFGYSRSLGGIKLPRAIKFCAALYSVGVPPELLGLSGLTEKEFDKLHEFYVKLDEDLLGVGKYLNLENLKKMPAPVRKGVQKVVKWAGCEPDEEYAELTSKIYSDFLGGKQAHIAEDIKAAAWKRRFLG